MLDYKVIFHFIGNTADNFKYYWEPLLNNLPSNCKIWGERKDTDLFYAAADAMYFCSREELNPICIKEAIAHNTTIFLYNHETYMNKYKENNKIHFIVKDDPKSQLLKDLGLVEKPMMFRMPKKTPIIKLVHLLSLPNTEREISSVQSIAPLAQFGIRYIQHVNPPTTILPEELKQKDRPMLTAGHLGCYLAFKNAIENEFTDDIDFLMVCECDCKLLVSHQEFYDNVLLACQEIVDQKVGYFSFGDTKDLEAGVLQSESYPNGYNTNFSFQTTKIIGLQSIFFPKTERKYLKEQFLSEPWTGPDIWFNNIFKKEGKKMAVVKKRLTTQFNGTSLIDNQPKKLL